MLTLEPSKPTLEQVSLSEKYLTNHEENLLALRQYLRHLADLKLSQNTKTFDDKPYPYGHCLEITLAVMESLQNHLTTNSPTNDQKADAALLAILEFLKAGGKIDRVWGDLRGEYFQNALRVGHYYVDVSNDTVDSTKPPVEMLPFEKSGMVALRDFEHFADLGSRYWNRTFYANTIFPSLAPFFPILSINKKGNLKIEGNDYLIALSSSEDFSPAIEAINSFAQLPKELKAKLTTLFAKSQECSNTTSKKTIEQIKSVSNSPPTTQQKLQREAIRKMEEINTKLNKITIGEKNDKK